MSRNVRQTTPIYKLHCVLMSSLGYVFSVDAIVTAFYSSFGVFADESKKCVGVYSR